jgi:hypothetical protein
MHAAHVVDSFLASWWLAQEESGGAGHSNWSMPTASDSHTQPHFHAQKGDTKKLHVHQNQTQHKTRTALTRTSVIHCVACTAVVLLLFAHVAIDCTFQWPFELGNDQIRHCLA